MTRERILDTGAAQKILSEVKDPTTLSDVQLGLVLEAQRKLAREAPDLAVGRVYRTGEIACAEAWKRLFKAERTGQ